MCFVVTTVNRTSHGFCSAGSWGSIAHFENVSTWVSHLREFSVNLDSALLLE